MALDVTVGGPDATSYVTVAEADSYLAGRSSLQAAGWHDLTEALKEPRIRLAATLLDRLPFRGVRACLEQALAFPRLLRRDSLYGQGDSDTVAGRFDTYADVTAKATQLGTTAPGVPQLVKDAQCELLFQVAHPLYDLDADTTESLEADRGIASVNLAGQIDIAFDPAESAVNRAMTQLLGDDVLVPIMIVRALLHPYLAKIRGRVVGRVT